MNTDTIQITPGLLALFSEIDEFKGAWRALGTLVPERLNALRRVATIESVGSSTRIKGSKLTEPSGVMPPTGSHGCHFFSAPCKSRFVILRRKLNEKEWSSRPYPISRFVFWITHETMAALR